MAQSKETNLKIKRSAEDYLLKETNKGQPQYVINFPQLMEQWDFDKNNNLGYDPTKITLGSNKKVWWICSLGHSYDAAVSNRNHGNGCPYCKGKKVLKGFNDLETWCKDNNRIDLINEFDREKNTFSMQEISKGSRKDVWWICPNGHSYKATVSHRVKMNTGCGACSHKVFLEGYNDLQTTHPHIAKEFDVEKNGITPNKVMAGSNNKKYWFICPKGHSYQATLLNRKKGRNCPDCVKEMHISFPEKCIVYYLNKLNLNVEESYHAQFLGKKEVDIFLPDFKIAIEYDGRAWHKNIERDLEKDKTCHENGIQLIRIREKGCPVYDSTSTKFFVEVDNIKDLESAIKFIIDIVNTDALKHLKINVEKDRPEIYELLELNEKKNSLQDRCPQITLFWDKEKNGKLTPKQVSFSSVKPIHLKCSENHEWISNAQNFLKSPKCPICSGERILPGYNDLGTTHPHLKNIWSEKNVEDISSFSYGSNTYALWNCDVCGGEYKMKISEKASKNFGCPYCNNRKLFKGYNDLATRYPKLAQEWSLNNSSNPEDYLPQSKQPVLWKCSKGHEYEATIFSRTTKKKTCPYCSNKQVLQGFNDLESCNPKLAQEFDSEKNNLLPCEVVYGGKKEYWWKCNLGHSYKFAMAEKILGYGCPICSSHRLLPGFNDLETLNPQLAFEFNVEKNNGTTAKDYFAKSGKKVWWKCSKCGHEWQAQIIKRNSGRGCPQCYKNGLKKQTKPRKK